MLELFGTVTKPTLASERRRLGCKSLTARQKLATARQLQRVGHGYTEYPLNERIWPIADEMIFSMVFGVTGDIGCLAVEAARGRRRDRSIAAGIRDIT